MRYIPSTDRAVSIDEIAEQCRQAILRANQEPDFYDEVCQFEEWDEEIAAAVW